MAASSTMPDVAIASIEESVVTLVREATLLRLQERLVAQAGVAVERAGYQVLRAVAEHGPLRLGDLAHRLGVDASTVSRHALEEHHSSLTEVDGIGPVLGVRLIGRTGRAAGFRSADSFASYAGVAPIEASSGERVFHRLSRSGDRQLDSALHLVAVTQVRMRASKGRRFFGREIAEGKTRNEAMRCLKRRIAAHVWRRMLADERCLHHGPEQPAIAA